MLKVKVERFDVMNRDDGYSAKEANQLDLGSMSVDESEWQKLPEFVALILRPTLQVAKLREVTDEELDRLKHL